MYEDYLPEEYSQEPATRQLPADILSERTLLGAVMADSSKMQDIIEIIGHEKMFYDNRHRSIFIGMVRLHASGEHIDLPILANKLTQDEMIGAAGGTDYLKVLAMDEAGFFTDVVKLAKIIKENYLLRELILITSDISDKGYKLPPADDLMEEAQERIFQLATSIDKRGFRHLDIIMQAVLEKIKIASQQEETITGISTGFTALDSITLGLREGEMVLIAARPSMGKTALAVNICQHIAFNLRKTVAIFSVEMDSESLAMRMLSTETKIDSKKLSTGRISTQESQFIADKSSEFKQSKLYIDDSPGITVAQMRGRLRKLIMKAGDVDLIMIDYMQLLDGGHMSKDRQNEISFISRSIKGLARDMKCPVVVLSQLSRSLESRSDKRPILSDLRDSGAIEQDADIVMFINREEYYLKEKTPPNLKSIAEIIIAKNRNGEIGSAYLGWEPMYTRFYNIDVATQTRAMEAQAASRTPKSHRTESN